MVPNIFFEKTLEDIIIDNIPDMPAHGLDIFYSDYARQVMLPDGGFLDLITWKVVDNEIYARIIELKREDVDITTCGQVLNYYSEFVTATMGSFKDYHVEVVLIGTKISSSLKSLMHISSRIRAFEYSYTLKGLSFKEYENNYDKVKKIYPTMPKDTSYNEKVLKVIFSL